ncbi:MAG: hypothetical protein M1839_000741 [Geoglossum umbratile]|nr:MAG: hypothetical protein M1839_000741 [Geoglossum umbratile]
MAVMTKSLLTVWLCLAGALAATIPARSEEAKAPLDTAGLKVVQYEGPRYEMTKMDLESLQESWRTGGNWDRPADMPIIELEAGTILDFGNSTLAKRSGQHTITAYSDWNCQGAISQVSNFGCGTGCIALPQTGLSGSVGQEFHGNPYPTMDVWTGTDCTGTKQHFGVVDTWSCSNTNTNGFRSYVGWYNC